MSSPTSRTMQELKDRGFKIGKTEHWLALPKHPAGGIRQDLFNFIDLIYLDTHTTKRIVAVQCTSGSNHSARIAKIKSIPEALLWLQCGGLIEVWSWAKKGPRGERKVWTFRRHAITEQDFQNPEAPSPTPPKSEEEF